MCLVEYLDAFITAIAMKRTAEADGDTYVGFAAHDVGHHVVPLRVLRAAPSLDGWLLDVLEEMDERVAPGESMDIVLCECHVGVALRYNCPSSDIVRVALDRKLTITQVPLIARKNTVELENQKKCLVAAVPAIADDIWEVVLIYSTRRTRSFLDDYPPQS